MAVTYPLRIVTPDESVYDGEIESLILPAALGSMGVLAHHAPLLTYLTQGKMMIRDGEGKTRYFEVNGGILEISEGGAATILADQIQPL